MRAIAIIAVVIIHTCPSGEWQVFVRPFVNFSVGLFLFLSGYLTKIDNTDWKSFYKRRILRVLIPYIIWTLLYTTVNFIEIGFEPKKYIINLLSTKASATLYYIFVYIQFVILTPFLGKLAKSKFKWGGFIVSPISVLIKYYWLFSNSLPNKYISAIWDICCLGWFTFYYIGLLLGNGLIKKQYSIKRLSLLYVISIVIQMIEGYGWLALGNSNCGTQLKLSSILTSSIFILIAYWYINNSKINFKNDVLVKMGDFSFGIYIAHLLILRLLIMIPFWNSIPFLLNSITVLLITFSFVIICSKVFGKKLSKWIGLC